MTLVYKLPGPITIASASSIASTTPGATLQFVGFINIRFILLVFEFTISGILSYGLFVTFDAPNLAANGHDSDHVHGLKC